MKKEPNQLPRLTLPAAAVQKLRRAGIYCNTSITVEFQQATKRHVLRGRESGGATRQFGHYMTFCGDGGDRLPWLLRPDSLTSNGDHAIVLAQVLVSVEMLRVEHTYELLVARHELRAEKQGGRPRIHSKLVFRGWQGQLPLDLVERDRAISGKIAPEFFTRAGEVRQLPAAYVAAIESATAAANCVACSHAHFLVAPNAAAAAKNGSGAADRQEAVDTDQQVIAATE
jgi:hypothetical protein